MKENAINWDAVPDVITKDQLYRICHISKSTALYLLQSGKIPCKYTGRKTRCYKIKKEDVIAYLENRKVFPESYSAPAGWYKGDYTVQTGSSNRAGAFAAVLYRAALRLSRCADYTGGFQNHRLWQNFNQQLVQSGAHQVFPEKQRQPHSEGLFGGVLLCYLLSHHHPQVTVAHPHPARLLKLAENP